MKQRVEDRGNYKVVEMEVETKNLSRVLLNLEEQGVWGIRLTYLDINKDNIKTIVRFCVNN